MGGSSVFKAPIKIAQKAGIIKKATPPPAPKPVAPPVVTPVVSPTVAEVSQSEAANADSYDLRKTKRKGRSATIMTGPAGAKNEDLVLGKRSLLGS
jgi:hypothetical protein|tara:strand:+ start:47 stop:334 length:288 start_codon:yes stop_codon:yes gene_type:complete